MLPRYLGFEMVIGKKANPQAVSILVPIKKASCLQCSIGTEHTAPVTVKGNRVVSKTVVSDGDLLSGPDQKRFIQPFEVVRVTECEVAVVLKEDGKIALYGPGLQDVFLIGKVVDIQEGLKLSNPGKSLAWSGFHPEHPPGLANTGAANKAHLGIEFLSNRHIFAQHFPERITPADGDIGCDVLTRLVR